MFRVFKFYYYYYCLFFLDLATELIGRFIGGNRNIPVCLGATRLLLQPITNAVMVLTKEKSNT